ncbi:hypothetical protein FLL45_13620 [Aliikangiella marina]|uniref:Uncharacterized protein n=1 Tax=Aliikangiella marina TaxID=1712262 RepID=A0A545T9L5_9GAMM|nr:hypothetical protein [Aliikangiella marina]TQV73898.1 hypothetical protein FLL45_13620 [Aliikangiella marina]
MNIEPWSEIDSRLVNQLRKCADEKRLNYLDKVSNSITYSYIEFLKCASEQKMDYGQVFGDFHFLSAYQLELNGERRKCSMSGSFEA